MQATSLLQGGAVSPDICQYRGGQTKSHNVRHRIQLYSNFGGCFGHARNASVKHVKEERPTNCLGSVVQVAGGLQQISSCTAANKLKSAYAGHHGVEAHTDIGGSKNGGY